VVGIRIGDSSINIMLNFFAGGKPQRVSRRVHANMKGGEEREKGSEIEGEGER